MKPVDPEEISALLDGELSSQRADEVRRAIARDHALRSEYEKLSALDGDLKAHAETMVLRPRISVVATPAFRIPLVPLVFSFLLLRVVLKSTSPVIGTGVEILVLAFLVGWALQRLLSASEQECRSVRREVAATS